jgi:hypothetical protein
MKRLLSFCPPGSPAEDLGPAGGAAGIAEHAAREGAWPAIEPINRYEDDMTNRLEQAVGLGEEIERQLGLGSACRTTPVPRGRPVRAGRWRGVSAT